MEEEKHQIEFDDLPALCVAEMVKQFKTREHRNDARLVCKVWRHLIDSDSSSERYLIDLITTKHNKCSTIPQFRDFISQFLNYNRKKISFRFESVDLRNTEHFWAEKGVHIIGLNFEDHCKEIPLEHVFSECTRLREMYIEYDANEIIAALESLALKRLYNYSMNILTVDDSKLGYMREEVVIRLVGLISEVFPSVKKVTLKKYHKINWNEAKISEMLDHLTYELELKSDKKRIVFDLSSETPVSVKEVSISNWDTLSPYEYYKNVEDIIYTITSFNTFRLSRLENILPRYLALRSLHMECGPLTCDLQQPIVNRLKELRLFDISDGSINAVFLDTFQFLKVLHLRYASHATFQDILPKMQRLEDFTIVQWITIADEYEKINDDEEQERRPVLVHETLKSLTIPPLTPRTIYRFDNLMQLDVNRCRWRSKPMHNFDEILQRFQCPNLVSAQFKVQMTTSKSVDFLWFKNLTSTFPKLKQFEFRLCSFDRLTADEELELRQTWPKLYVSSAWISTKGY